MNENLIQPVDRPPQTSRGYPGPQRCSRCGRTWEQHQGYTCRTNHQPNGSPGFWLIVSIIWAIASALVFAYTDSAATTCKNALVGALDQPQCTSVTFWHDISGLSGFAALIAIFFAGLVMYRGRQS